jgi:type VI secretion system ImpJ/VasE family protein
MNNNHCKPGWPVFRDGISLLASHFQQITRSAEAEAGLVTRHDDAACGIVSLNLQDELYSGTLGLTSCEAVMPDGTWIRIPEVDSCESLSDLEQMIPPGETAQVFLTVGKRDAASWLVDPSTGIGRFRVAEAGIPDEFDPGREHETIEVLQRQVALKVSLGRQSLPAELSRLPIARLIRQPGDHRLRVQESFVPPCLSLRPVRSSPSYASLRALLEKMLDRIENNLRELQVEVTRFQAPSVLDMPLLRTYLLLQALLPQHAVLRRLLVNAGASPRQLYLELVRLIEALRPLHLDVTEECAAYQHEALYETFDSLRRLLDQLLETKHDEYGIRYQVEDAPLPGNQKVDGALYRFSDLDRNRVAAGHIYIGIAANLDPADLDKLVARPGVVKVACREKAIEWQVRTKNGIGLRKAPAKALEHSCFERRPDLTYFQISNYNRRQSENVSWEEFQIQAWREIEQTRVLEVYFKLDDETRRARLRAEHLIATM